MILAVKSVLIMFIIFLSTPTIVSLVQNNCNTSLFYSMSEEELLHKQIKVLKVEFKCNNYDSFALTKLSSSCSFSENQLKHNTVSATIFHLRQTSNTNYSTQITNPIFISNMAFIMVCIQC